MGGDAPNNFLSRCFEPQSEDLLSCGLRLRCTIMGQPTILLSKPLNFFLQSCIFSLSNYPSRTIIIITVQIMCSRFGPFRGAILRSVHVTHICSDIAAVMPFK